MNMGDDAQLYYATAAFIATHFISSTPLRGVLVRGIGERAYLALYSLVAFATLGWMIRAYNHAPLEPLWVGTRWLPAVVMPFSFILLACGLLSRNPTLVGADKLLRNPEPARGIIRVTRHPVMWSIMLWSLAHLLARGEHMASVFFGGFFVVAALGALVLDQRKARTLGEDWKRFAAVTSYLPFGAVLQGRNRFDGREIGWRNPTIGLALYALFFWFHPLLFGIRAY
ncbi:MAG TPA: NnrU family protein [Burkholderiales bacterium]|nr:NnrU family protein [Burkholderiales bacterium]